MKPLFKIRSLNNHLFNVSPLHWSRLKISTLQKVFYRSKGLSLIELLVGLLLSSIITLAAMQLIVSQMQTSYAQEGLSTAAENGQFGLQFVRDELQMAGANAKPSGDAVLPIVWHLATDGDRFDSITVQRHLSAKGDQLCTGAPTPATTNASQPTVVWSEYLVQSDSTRTGVYQLVCRYRYPGKLAQINDAWVPSVEGHGIIIDGVAGMQILYGVAAVDQFFDTTAQFYLPRDQIDPMRDRIVDIQLALLLHSETTFAVNATSALHTSPTYALLDKALSTNNNGLDGRRLRRSFYLHVPLKQQSRAIEVL